MLPAVIRGKKRVAGDLVKITTFTSPTSRTEERGILRDYNSEDDEILVEFTPSDTDIWLSLDPQLDDVEFITSNGKGIELR
jgi:hypothetical protein